MQLRYSNPTPSHGLWSTYRLLRPDDYLPLANSRTQDAGPGLQEKVGMGPRGEHDSTTPTRNYSHVDMSACVPLPVLPLPLQCPVNQSLALALLSISCGCSSSCEISGEWVICISEFDTSRNQESMMEWSELCGCMMVTPPSVIRGNKIKRRLLWWPLFRNPYRLLGC